MKRIHLFFLTSKKIFFALGFAGLLFHIIYFQSINSLMLLPFLSYWFVLGIIYRLSERFFFGIALFFLVLVPIFFLLGNFALAEKLSVWEFLFIILGLGQWILFDVIFTKKKKR